MGPTWPFLLMYGFHDMRHLGFRRLTMINGTPRVLGCHSRKVLLPKEDTRSWLSHRL